MHLYRHLSDFRTTLLLRARSSVAGEDMVRKAEACAGALTEAERLLVEHGEGAYLQELLARAGELLDELDECLLVLAHDDDHAVFAQLELLRETLNGLEDQRRRSA